MALIECQKLRFTYPDCDDPALDGVSFTLERGEFVLVCGKSGCGKSTLLRHLKKNMIPYGKAEGRALYRGVEIEDLPDRQSAAEIGFVQQSPEQQIVTDKVWHELAFGLESLGLDQRSMRQRVAEMASFFGIQGWFRKNVRELSGGQKQLLNLASIMVMQPRLLILDEPTAQLDPIAASDFIATLKKINTELGVTVLISEHRLEELFPVADRVLVMDRGRIELDAPPREAARAMAAGVAAEMTPGLPAVIRIAMRCGETEKPPLTVREGRLWLENRLGEPPEAGEPPRAEKPKKDKNAETPAIAMREVFFRYERGGRELLRGVDLEVPAAKLTAILGGNGVGKSTTLKLLTRSVKPERGRIELGGQRLDKLTEEELFTENMVLLPQDPQALFTELTALEELEEALSGQKLTDAEKKERSEAMLRELELERLSGTHPYDLSGGEQQRLALGKLLLLKPKLLLLDEPTKGLDPFFKQTLAALFRRLTGEGVTILMVSHDLEFCARYADRCALMFDGQIVSAGTPRQVLAGNRFYTTAAGRLAAPWFPEAILWEEVAAGCEEASTPSR